MLVSGDNNSKHQAPAASAPRRRSPWPLIIVALLFIVVPFLAWYLTWFGRGLSDEEIGKYLSDQQNPRHVQHALAQIEEKIERGDRSVKRWYPQIVALADSPVMEVRQTAAWVMGQDNTSEDFHGALFKLLADQHPLVRRNAALQLVRFKDARGRAELRAMLEPYDVTTTGEGTVASVLAEGSAITVGTMIARIDQGAGRVLEVRSPLPGKITSIIAREGAKVSSGDTLLQLSPDIKSVSDALLALGLVGEREDLASVQRYAQGTAGLPDEIKQQAALTVKAIESRSAQTESTQTQSSK